MAKWKVKIVRKEKIMNAFGRVIAVILAAILMFLFPLQYLAINQEAVLDSHVHSETTQFADEIMLQGYLTKDMYSTYSNELATTNQLYDIELVHSKPLEGYDIGSSSTSSIEDKLLQTSTYITHKTEKRFFGANIVKASHETTEDQVGFTTLSLSNKKVATITPNRAAKTGGIQQMATHVHIDVCYAGHRHNASCLKSLCPCGNPSGKYYISARSAYYEGEANTVGAVCYDCGAAVIAAQNRRYQGDFYNFSCKNWAISYAYGTDSNGVTTGNPLVVKAYNNLISLYSLATEYYGATYTSDGMLITETNLMRALTQKHGAGAVYFWWNQSNTTSYIDIDSLYLRKCGSEEDITPICNQVVTSITATSPTQTVIKGTSIHTTATATYLDGHTGTVACTSNYNGAVGTQIITLTFTGYVYNAKTSGSITCNATITTKANTISCTAGKGHPDYSGEFTLCPICRAIEGLSANNSSVPYDGAQHGLSINNTTGTATIVYYDIEPGSGVVWSTTAAPSAVGAYPVHIYVHMYNTITGSWGDWFAMERYITIYPVLNSITANISATTIYRGASFPISSLLLNYNNGTSETISNGWTISGFNSKDIGTQKVTISYGGKSTVVSILVKRNIVTCEYGHTYELDDYDTDDGCPVCKVTLKSISVSPEYITVEKGSNLDISVTATYLDGHTQLITSGWTSNFITNQLGNQLVTVTYQDKLAYVSVIVVENITCPICGTVYQPSSEEPGCPICSKKVVSIVATPTTQTIQYSENITLEVMATYLDGHRAVITDWTSNLNSFKVGTQTVTIYYQTITTKVTVIVASETETTCPICGTVYNSIEYPNGCPICSKAVKRIEARLRNGGTQVQYGSELNLAVVLIFKDGHREIAYNGWSVEGYQAEILGIQTLTVTYNEHQTTLAIEVVNSLSTTICINGHVYYMNEDGSDPGCPYCGLDSETETSQGYFDCIYTVAILAELDANGIYYFEEGDTITVTVIPKTRTFFDKLQHLFSVNANVETKYSYGGMIDNESI